jgi:NAD-dependent SIR2 family protein deacetylase
MARFIQYPCICEKGSLTSHRVLGIHGEVTIVKCDKCSVEKTKGTAKANSLKKQGWPYYNDSVGVAFESESHEKHYVKENNLTKCE